MHSCETALCKKLNDLSTDWVYSITIDLSAAINNIDHSILLNRLDAGMWRYHANRMDARRSQFDLGRVDAYI